MDDVLVYLQWQLLTSRHHDHGQGRSTEARPPTVSVGTAGARAVAFASAAAGGAAAQHQQHVPLAALEAKIDEVMEACGFDHDASMTTLQKLALLEA